MSFQAEFQWKSNKDSPFQVELCMFCQKALSQHDFSINVGRTSLTHVKNIMSTELVCTRNYTIPLKIKLPTICFLRDSTTIHRVVEHLIEMHTIWKERKNARNNR